MPRQSATFSSGDQTAAFGYGGPFRGRVRNGQSLHHGLLPKFSQRPPSRYRRTLTAMDIKACLKEAVQSNASDFHIVVGIPPTLRIDGTLVMMQQKVNTREQAKTAIYGILTEE